VGKTGSKKKTRSGVCRKRESGGPRPNSSEKGYMNQGQHCWVSITVGKGENREGKEKFVAWGVFKGNCAKSIVKVKKVDIRGRDAPSGEEGSAGKGSWKNIFLRSRKEKTIRIFKDQARKGEDR